MMMKQYFLSVIVTCMFCLVFLPVQAKNLNDSLSAKQNGEKVTDVPQQKTNIVVQSAIEKKIKVYPNPVSRGNLLTIELPDDRKELTVFIYNTVGKVIRTFKVTDRKTEFNAPDTSGIYLLRFVEKQKVIAVEKIVVKG